MMTKKNKKKRDKKKRKRNLPAIDLDAVEFTTPVRSLGRKIPCICCCCGHEFEMPDLIYREFKGECPECDSLYFEANHPAYPDFDDVEAA